ncbi:MAG TPA: alpha/beta fold hydrolase [Actinomycetales bacterium]|nr:alpha/beta fold hydrolase [Actinomycetales bacterium]
MSRSTPRSPPLAWPAWSAVLVSPLLLGVGSAIGVRYLRATGLSWMTLVGLASLLLGLVAGVWGVATVARLVTGWRRLVAVPVIAVPLLIAVYLVAIPVAVMVVPRSQPTRTPAQLRITYRDVAVSATDGVRLSAWLMLPDVARARRPAVVALHGAGSNRAATLDQAAVLVRHGYVVLALDARGHGGSGGRAMDWGWNGDADVGGAVSLLASRPEVDPSRIAVLGLSMGGEEAIGAAAADDRIRAVVAEGATGRSADDYRWLSEVYGWRGALQEQLLAAQTAIVDVLTRAPRPATLQSAATSAGPLLLITAGNRPDELHAARRIERAAGSRVTVWNVPGSDHTAGLRTSPAAWEETVVAFLDSSTTAP